MVPGSAPALGCRRVRLAPDLSKQPPACGRIFFNSAREGACWCTRGRVRSPGPRRCRAIFCGAAASIPVAELGTSFDGAWHGLASCSRNFKCRAFRVGRAHSIFRRVRMTDPPQAMNKMSSHRVVERQGLRRRVGNSGPDGLRPVAPTPRREHRPPCFRSALPGLPCSAGFTRPWSPFFYSTGLAPAKRMSTSLRRDAQTNGLQHTT